MEADAVEIGLNDIEMMILDLRLHARRLLAGCLVGPQSILPLCRANVHALAEHSLPQPAVHLLIFGNQFLDPVQIVGSPTCKNRSPSWSLPS